MEVHTRRPPIQSRPGTRDEVYGDRVAASRFDYLLQELLKDCGKWGNSKSLELEPLETLWRFLEMPTSLERPLPLNRRPESIGGSPQVLRIRSGAVATPFVVRWGSAGNESDVLLGRGVLTGENLDLPLIARSEDARTLRQYPRGQWAPHAR